MYSPAAFRAESRIVRTDDATSTTIIPALSEFISELPAIVNCVEYPEIVTTAVARAVETVVENESIAAVICSEFKLLARPPPSSPPENTEKRSVSACLNPEIASALTLVDAVASALVRVLIA